MQKPNSNARISRPSAHRDDGKTAIYTIGHSNRPVDAFIKLLRDHEIALVVDIRIIPASRANPQFGQDALRRALNTAGIEYAHEPLLGGRRHARKDSPNTGWKNASFRGYADYMATEEFARGLRVLLSRAADKTTAIMCAEAVPWRCHRMLVSDALKRSGMLVRHITGGGKPSPHRYTSFLRVRKGILTYPEPAV